MKKVLALTLLSLSFASSYAFAGAGVAGTAMATGAVSNPAVSIYGGNSQQNAQDAKSPLIKLSSKVSATINYDETGKAVGTSSAYAIGTKHVDGSKIFGTAWNSTTIFFKQNASGTALTNANFGSANDNTNFGVAGWTAY
ncbi:hypothetical protein [Geomonas propionica]|uniref:Uncharacterized protein n=1 Tax=Geomonas propionica TaxID=2798582 RepID=A0ABS0YMQ9_9BACT|nr:hypothetical protein [Geomonas propionica]MBJ6799263.1 hypothetical protein [Geomonas propionica]